MHPQEFAQKWTRARLKERSASHEHFIDLCRMVGHPTPAEFDPKGETFTFEKGARKDSGRPGFADVWYKDHFGWEYKGKGEDLKAAYGQLLKYRDNLANPKLLIASDFDTIVIHTNFNGTVSWIYPVTLDHFQDSTIPVEVLEPTGVKAKTGPRLSGIAVIRACFENPDLLAPGQTTEALTADAAKRFEIIANSLKGPEEMG
jgi:hypothetical protein